MVAKAISLKLITRPEINRNHETIIIGSHSADGFKVIFWLSKINSEIKYTEKLCVYNYTCKNTHTILRM